MTLAEPADAGARGITFTRHVFGGASFLVVATPQPRRPAWAATLTPAEHEVLTLVGRGMTNAQIATARGCGAPTVAKQMTALKRKTRCDERLGLARLARQLRGESPVVKTPGSLASPKEIGARAALRAHTASTAEARPRALTNEAAATIWRDILSGRQALVEELDWAGTRLFVVRATEEAATLHALTEGERQVLRFVLDGRANKVIASDLGIVASTVSLRIRAIFDKLGCSDRAALLDLGEALGGERP